LEPTSSATATGAERESRWARWAASKIQAIVPI